MAATVTPRVIGLDLSLTSTGIALYPTAFNVAQGNHPEYLIRSLKPPKGVGLEVGRLVWLRDHVIAYCMDHASPSTGNGSGLVVIEGYSYNSKFSHGHQQGELGGIIKLQLHEARIPFAIVAPTVRAKYATGKGNAGKDQVLVQAVKRSGLEFLTNDESDAWWLLAMGRDYLGAPIVDMPAANRAALSAVDWPVIDVPEAVGAGA